MILIMINNDCSCTAVLLLAPLVFPCFYSLLVCILLSFSFVIKQEQKFKNSIVLYSILNPTPDATPRANFSSYR